MTLHLPLRVPPLVPLPLDGLVAIDPGRTTGFAVFEMNQLSFTRALSIEELFQSLADLKPPRVVVETPPNGSYGVHQEHIRLICPKLRELYPQAVWILPGEWKNSPRAYKQTHFRTTHEWDAACLGYYAILYKFRLETK